jgi:hypothetical protein
MARGESFCRCFVSTAIAWLVVPKQSGFDLTGDFCTSGSERESQGASAGIPTKRYKPEQIMTLLRQVGVVIANGKLTPQACREAGISEQTFYRWRKEYGV